VKSENRSVALGVLKSEASNPFRSEFFCGKGTLDLSCIHWWHFILLWWKRFRQECLAQVSLYCWRLQIFQTQISRSMVYFRASKKGLSRYQRSATFIQRNTGRSQTQIATFTCKKNWSQKERWLLRFCLSITRSLGGKNIWGRSECQLALQAPDVSARLGWASNSPDASDLRACWSGCFQDQNYEQLKGTKDVGWFVLIVLV